MLAISYVLKFHRRIPFQQLGIFAIWSCFNTGKNDHHKGHDWKYWEKFHFRFKKISALLSGCVKYQIYLYEKLVNPDNQNFEYFDKLTSIQIYSLFLLLIFKFRFVGTTRCRKYELRWCGKLMWQVTASSLISGMLTRQVYWILNFFYMNWLSNNKFTFDKVGGGEKFSQINNAYI